MYDPIALNLLENLLRINPHSRLTTEEALAHDFFHNK